MSARHDHDIRRLVGIELLHGIVEIERVYLAGGGEAILGRVGGAIIRDDDLKASRGSRPAKIDRDVSCTKKVKQCWRKYRFDENLECAAADQAGVVLRILIQVEL